MKHWKKPLKSKTFENYAQAESTACVKIDSYHPYHIHVRQAMLIPFRQVD